MGLFTASRTRRACLAVLAWGCLAAPIWACGTAGGVPGEPPFGQIGFVGGLGPGVGFIGGGTGHHDAGPIYGPDADADAGHTGQNDGASPPLDSSTPGDDGGQITVDAGDGGSSVGIVLNLPPGYFDILYWTITGPAGTYSGTLQIGAAQSIEFVVGGINAGSGYTLTLRGNDPSGDPCVGTSAPFAVYPSMTTATDVNIECFAGDGAAAATDVTTGSVAVDAGVLKP